MFCDNRPLNTKDFTYLRLSRPQCFLAKITPKLNSAGLGLIDDCSTLDLFYSSFLGKYPAACRGVYWKA